MALINHAKREINAKIVYYGREGAGKRLSLQYLYDRIKPSLRGNLKVVPASGDSLLFFDFSPFEQPVFGGYRIRFHMYCLTGKVTNPAAWKMTLKGADGVVIVADASPEMLPATRESISMLREFLAAYGVGLHDIPCVLQLNRVGSIEQSPDAGISAALDVPDMRTCYSDSGSGKGVLEALSLISRDIMDRIGNEDSLRVVERNMSPEAGKEADVRPPLHLAPEVGLLKNESTQSIAEELSLHGKKADMGKAVHRSLKVALAGESAVCGDGTVRIPLEITLGGASRRLVVSIAIEEG
jgi:signal recognition particle receptor subunit beta